MRISFVGAIAGVGDGLGGVLGGELGLGGPDTLSNLIHVASDGLFLLGKILWMHWHKGGLSTLNTIQP